MNEYNAREVKSNERGSGAGGNRTDNATNVNWSAIGDNGKGEGNRVSEQFSNYVIGEIQRKVRDVKDRTDRITGNNKSEGQEFRGQQSDVQQGNVPGNRENKSYNIRAAEEPKSKIREDDWGLDR